MNTASGFAGQSVFVTGAGSGIGFGVCRAFARAGAVVALCDLDQALASDAAGRINAEVGRSAAIAYGFDAGHVPALQEAVAAFEQSTGRLDVAIANAGITMHQGFFDATPEAFDRLTGVNLRGSFFLAQTAARLMRERKSGGRILLVSSTLAQLAMPNVSVYAMTKAGGCALARNLAVDLGGFGITVNAVAPGATLTERTAVERKDYADQWGRLAATGQVATVDDIAAAVLFLCSPQARQITGQTLFVDGAWAQIGRWPESYG